MTLSDASRHFAAAAASLSKDIAAAEAAMLKDAKAKAIQGSASTLGPVSPLSRPTAPPFIGKRTGVFWASWTVLAPVVTPQGVVSQVVDLAPYSPMLRNGPLLTAWVQEQVQPERIVKLRAAVSRALSER